MKQQRGKKKKSQSPPPGAFRRLVLVRITHYPRHTRQRCQFLRRPLRVAACHQNAAIGIHSPQSPYRCARIFIRARGHRAGVQHHNFGVASHPGALQSTLQKLPLQRGPIRLRSAAAKILYVEARHVPIVNDWMRLNSRDLRVKGRCELLPQCLAQEASRHAG